MIVKEVRVTYRVECHQIFPSILLFTAFHCQIAVKSEHCLSPSHVLETPENHSSHLNTADYFWAILAQNFTHCWCPLDALPKVDWKHKWTLLHITNLQEVPVYAARMRFYGVVDCSILHYKSDFWPSFSVDTGVINASADCECFVVMMGDSLHFSEPDRLLLESGWLVVGLLNITKRMKIDTYYKQ